PVDRLLPKCRRALPNMCGHEVLRVLSSSLWAMADSPPTASCGQPVIVNAAFAPGLFCEFADCAIAWAIPVASQLRRIRAPPPKLYSCASLLSLTNSGRLGGRQRARPLAGGGLLDRRRKRLARLAHELGQHRSVEPAAGGDEPAPVVQRGDRFEGVRSEDQQVGGRAG